MARDWEPFRPAFAGDIIALDPGNTRTGWISLTEDDSVVGHMKVHGHGHTPNIHIRQAFAAFRECHDDKTLLIECPRPAGQLMSAETMETLVEIGRFLQMWRGAWSFVFRVDVKKNLLGAAKGKDSQVTQALKDRFGGESRAVGGKKCDRCKGKKVVGPKRCPKCGTTRKGSSCRYCKNGSDASVREQATCNECDGTGWRLPPGPFYKMTGSHTWAALGVACWWQDLDRPHQHEIAGKQPTKRKTSDKQKGKGKTVSGRK